MSPVRSEKNSGSKKIRSNSKGESRNDSKKSLIH